MITLFSNKEQLLGFEGRFSTVRLKFKVYNLLARAYSQNATSLTPLHMPTGM